MDEKRFTLWSKYGDAPHPATVRRPPAPLAAARPALPTHAALAPIAATAQPSFSREQVKAFRKWGRDQSVDLTKAPTCFVLCPTRASYDDVTTLVANTIDDQRQKMLKGGDNDVITLSSEHDAKTFAKPLTTGAPAPQLDLLAYLISTAPNNSTIHIVISGHGSPGKHGRIGMGPYELSQVDAPETHLRVAPDELAAMLAAKLKPFRRRKFVFDFRCCNSGYVRFGKHSFNESTQCTNVAALSLIAVFRAAIIEKLPRTTVIGYHGYFQWSSKGPEVYVDSSSRVAFTKAAVCISEAGVATLSDASAISGKLGCNKELDAYFD